jgi:asparagine synthetase B (glutamine-hydrolysing)
MLHRLRGIFALAIWMREGGSTGCDRIGIKPLYYTCQGDASFSPGDQAILAFPASAGHPAGLHHYHPS